MYFIPYIVYMLKVLYRMYDNQIWKFKHLYFFNLHKLTGIVNEEKYSLFSNYTDVVEFSFLNCSIKTSYVWKYIIRMHRQFEFELNNQFHWTALDQFVVFMLFNINKVTLQLKKEAYLETLIWLIMWKIASLFLLEKMLNFINFSTFLLPQIKTNSS